ncbi:MAG: TetR/AcrR family transcriptional regulator [Chloroflexi bacterium]|nr:MAG: TetR/AcrR family transcriptional regulator [Chloroflexota bacterium]RPI96915.1 MAG: TetR/AcrR family transcriptional regulator [Chloroflexota bacterium]
MVRNTNTKRAIMDLAEAFLQDKGFNGFSYAHIASELGVKNAAIHYHFPSKEELVCAVIQRYRDRFQLWINNSRVKNLSYQEKLDWFFNIYVDTRVDHGKVCLAGSLETEFNSLPTSLREQTEALTHELLAWLQATLHEGREAGVFHFGGDPANKAALILSSLQGALQMARALGTDKFHAVVQQHKQDLLA